MRLRRDGGPRAPVFARVYEARAWEHEGSRSGPGSGLARTARLRVELAALLQELGARSLLDAGCGDFHWMAHTALPVRRYIGVDVVPELIAVHRRSHGGRGRRFLVRDIVDDRLPRADVVLCRDTLIHLPDADVRAALANIRRSGARWLLATTFTAHANERDVELGDWRPTNLQAPPFDLPAPARALEDIPLVDPELGADKRLALWPGDALPA